MKLPAYQFVAQISAAIAVVVSLGFVAYELKQSRDVATAELTISLLDSRAQLYLSILDVETYNRGIYKGEVSGEELTYMEKKNRTRVRSAEWIRASAQHLLWESGLLAEGEWEWERSVILDIWTYRPYLRPNWDIDEINFGRKSFRDELNSLWEIWKVENPAIYQKWIEEQAAEKAKQAAEEAEEAAVS
ncbi:MAG: hypothetical protein ABJ084_03855 [Halioglobus sp.]